MISIEEEEEAIAEETEIGAEEPKIIKKEDYLEFAKYIGLRDNSCPWSDDIVNTFVTMINHMLLNVDFAVERVNPHCLAILEGHPMSTIDTLKKYWDKHCAVRNNLKKDASNLRERIDKIKASKNKEFRQLISQIRLLERDAAIGRAIWNSASEGVDSALYHSIFEITGIRGDFEGYLCAI